MTWEYTQNDLDIPKIDLEIHEIDLEIPKIDIEIPEMDLEIPEVDLEKQDHSQLRIPFISHINGSLGKKRPRHSRN